MVIPSLEVDSVGIVARRGPLAVHSGGGLYRPPPPRRPTLRFGWRPSGPSGLFPPSNQVRPARPRASLTAWSYFTHKSGLNFKVICTNWPRLEK